MSDERSGGPRRHQVTDGLRRELREGAGEKPRSEEY